MKFDHAWIFAGQPRDETPAPPPGKRTPVLPRPVPPNRQVHLPHRTPPASCVWRTCFWRGRSTPRRPAKTAQPQAVIPASVAQSMPWKPACLRGPDWAASPQPACFGLLGGFRNWFGFLERRVACPTPPFRQPLEVAPAKRVGIRWPVRERPPSVFVNRNELTGVAHR